MPYLMLNTQQLARVAEYQKRGALLVEAIYLAFPHLAPGYEFRLNRCHLDLIPTAPKHETKE